MTAPKVRHLVSKPVHVTARQVDTSDPKGMADIAAWCGGIVPTWSSPPSVYLPDNDYPGDEARHGEWIVKHPDGTRSIHITEQLDAIYDEVGEPDDH